MERDSKIWLANLVSQPVEIEENQVEATAECVTEGPGTCLEDKGSGTDEVDRLVRHPSPHLIEGERQQLQAAIMARQQMFAAGKGDLGRTDIVQHQINMGDHPPTKQRVRRYPAARQEEERKLVKNMLEIGII